MEKILALQNVKPIENISTKEGIFTLEAFTFTDSIL